MVNITGFVQSRSKNEPVPNRSVESVYTYRVKSDEAGTPVIVPGRTVALTDSVGYFELDLPMESLGALRDPGVRIYIRSTTGAVVLDEVFEPPQLRGPLKLTIDDEGVVVLPPVPDPVSVGEQKLQGRVFDVRRGRPVIGVQVVLWGVPKDNGGKVPLLVSRTGRDGRFSEVYPNLSLKEAEAAVAGVRDRIPIPLTKGMLPNPVLIGIDLPDKIDLSGKDGCGCGGTGEVQRSPDQWDLAESAESFSMDLGTGDCVRLNVPNRSLDEYDYFSVVRTSQPDIHGSSGGIPDLAPPPPGGTVPGQPPAGVSAARMLSRAELSLGNSVDWDSDPTFFQAVTIAHGHLLHFKQVWHSDGYSLGDLLYSLPLAPGQKRLVAVVDWERREQTRREEGTLFSETLAASLTRDRDLNEIIAGALAEQLNGGSRSTTSGWGAGHGAAGNGSYYGFNFGALVGISGGQGTSDASAWQVSARQTSGSTLQQLRDRILQSASAVRGTRSTVVHAVTQGEAVNVSTEVVANHNRCHALTIEYFEVLRHLRVTHDLVDVQECLFVPLPITQFSTEKTVRWRESLAPYLRRPELGEGFDAAKRVQAKWAGTGTPPKRYADETMTSIRGELRLTFAVPLPPLPPPPPPNGWATAEEMSKALNPTTGVLGALLAVATGGASLVAGAVTDAHLRGAQAIAESLSREPSPQERYARFHREVMPGLAAGFVDQLELYAVTASREVALPGADFTLVSEYQPGSPLLVSVRVPRLPALLREEVLQVTIKSRKGLPSDCRVIINEATLRYGTVSFEHSLASDFRLNDDIDLPTVDIRVSTTFPPTVTITQTMSGSGATLFAPLDEWEQRSPRAEDIRKTDELVSHLNDNLEYYHHAIWWTMDPNRRFMLLDGFTVPFGDGRSVASVVENRLIGLVGNSLVLPLARGVHLDPRFRPKDKASGAELLGLYAPKIPLAPARVSIPTKGVFAEAVMGSCNACEEIDESRNWRWEDYPLDAVPGIEPTSTASRRTSPDAGLPASLPTPIVSIQNAPAVPDPAGVRAVTELLGRQAFSDITGLAATQAASAAAYKQALETAAAFGKEASTLAQQAATIKSMDKSLNTIDRLEADGKISAEDAKRLRLSILSQSAGDSATKVDNEELKKRINTVDEAAKQGSISTEDARKLNTEQLRSTLSSADLSQQSAAEQIAKIPAANIGGVAVHNSDGSGAAVTASPRGGAGGVLGMMQDLIMGALPGTTIDASSKITRRRCCALGQWNRGFSGALDPANTTGHKYGAAGGPTGYIYTSAAGLVDLGHVRDMADMTKFVYDGLVSGATVLDLYEGIAAVMTIPSLTTEKIELAGAISYVESWAHELTSWGSFDDFSSFSPEDIPSNIIGIEVAKRALAKGGGFDAAVDVELPKLLKTLGARPSSDTAAVFAKIEKDKWFVMLPFFPPFRLERRNFDGSIWPAGMAFDAPASLPWLSPLAFAPYYANFTYALKNSVDGKTGVTLATMTAETNAIKAKFTAAHPGMDRP